MRILVADDDPASWHLLAGVLNEAGHTPLWARDALQAARLAEAHRPDLMLLDLGMPGADGLGALLQLKTRPLTASIPVVVLSETTAEDLRREALADGALLFLYKPLDPELVLATVAAVLRPPASA